MSILVALSGGKASAWCADWALKNYEKEDVILYFNDTLWEHKDLYRFLNDLEVYFKHKITVDTDGRSPEDLFYEKNALASSRMPFCSHTLKGQMLQKFYKEGDTLVFGIHGEEAHRAKRIVEVYDEVSRKNKRKCSIAFPLIANNISKTDIDEWLQGTGIEEPELYKLGFEHNNCSGGCVRSGKTQWKLLYEKLPEVYADRERTEKEVREFTGKDIHYLKDITLETFRIQIETGNLGYYFKNKEKEQEAGDCIGICSTVV